MFHLTYTQKNNTDSEIKGRLPDTILILITTKEETVLFRTYQFLTYEK